MRLFLYEFTCAQADEGLPVSWRREGWAMLSAVAEDLVDAGIDVVTLLAPSCRVPAGVTCVRVGAGNERQGFCSLAADADWTLVIAPESDGLLAQRCRWVQEAGGRWLGCSCDAIELTADKLRLGQHLEKHGVPTPATVMWQAGEKPAAAFPLVLKPRQGAGSQSTFLLHTADQARAIAAHVAADPSTEFIVQAYVPGLPASLAFLIGPHQRIPLTPASQRLSDDGRFRYLGGVVPLEKPGFSKKPGFSACDRAVALAGRAVQSVAGLQGFVGVDLVLGDAADGSGDHVIEINPRITTSYIGLRRLCRANLAQSMISMANGAAVRDLSWHAGPVHFDA